MNVLLLFLGIGVFLYIALNGGERTVNKPGMIPVYVGLCIALLGFLAWPVIGPYVAPFFSPMMTH
ncbi:MAG: hypothetical protein ACRDHW_04405 [Ktedonobacteraceae bacterium]